MLVVVTRKDQNVLRLKTAREGHPIFSVEGLDFPIEPH